MKKVFKTSYEIMHLFAERSQNEAKNQSRNVFFYENKLYSYGYHYLLAEFITNNLGETAILINNKGYSVTTSKHISEVTLATRHYKQFFTLSTDPEKVLSELEILAEKLQRARKKENYINQALTLIESYNEFNTWKGGDIMNVVAHSKINHLIQVFNGKDYKEYLNEKAETLRIAELKRIEQEKKRAKESLKLFFGYKTNYVYNLSEDFCRLSKDKTMVETTQGVKVSIKSAKALYQLIQSGKDIQGFKIDNYIVIGLNGVLKIGCHRINKANMNKVGKLLLTM